MNPIYFIAVDAHTWRFARLCGREVSVRHTGGVDPAPLAEAMKELGYDGRPVRVGLPSEMVFAARIDCTGLGRTGRRQAMLYRLEEQLPLDAEGLSAVFLPACNGTSIGLAVQMERMRKIMDALAGIGVKVESIRPTALLAADACLAGAAGGADIIILTGGGMCDVLAMAQGRLASWEAGPMEELPLMTRVAAAPHTPGPASVIVLGAEAEAAAGVLAQVDQVAVAAVRDQPLFEAAALQAGVGPGALAAPADFASERISPAFGARALARRARGALVAACLAAALVAGGLYFRTVQYEQSAADLRRQQAAAYRQLYPAATPPPSIRSRLASELARLGGHQAPAQSSSALDALRRVLAALPADVKLQLEEARLSPGAVVLAGQTLAHGDVETLCRALEAAELTMEPPRTENLSRGGVSFTLSGKIQPEARP